MNKIKKIMTKFIKNVRRFTLLGLLLDHEVKKLFKEIGIKEKEVKRHQSLIKFSEAQIEISNEMIADFDREIRKINIDIDNIGKI